MTGYEELSWTTLNLVKRHLYRRLATPLNRALAGWQLPGISPMQKKSAPRLLRPSRAWRLRLTCSKPGPC